MFWSIILALVLLGLIWTVIREGHPLDKLPGPKRPVVGSILEFIGSNPRKLFELQRKFAKFYGDRYVVRILKRRILHVHNPNDIEVILSHSKNISKSLAYSFLEPWLGTGLLLSTGRKWHSRRKILTPTFHFNILKNFTPVLEEKSTNLVRYLRQAGRREHDLFPLISDVTLYAICETAMGTQLDQDKSTASVEYKQAILQMGTLLVERVTKFWLHNDFIFQRTAIFQKYDKILNKVHSFADEVILERKKQRTQNGACDETEDAVGKKKRMAMLDLLLEAESKGEIDLAGIREEVNTFMFEGHDTTATALTFGLMLLADHEEVQERVREEIERVVGSRVPTMTDLGELKYLEAVIKETLRLYPSVPFIARTITEDFMLGDIMVPKNSEVAVHIYDVHRRPEIYPEPDVFKPERFLNGTTRHNYAYVPFSAGPRNCIGQRFAMLEMKSILCEVCRNFKLLPRTKGWRPALVSDLVLRSTDHIYVTFEPRTSEL
ncbi:cytochrome P450 4C1-like [Pectinophora gossypiella]|uniref:cytochrome P450 4C1-like n=1 Tax=Pectinophora gossypiella TaxID=13191 RepID=UPI00214F4039|nr:cytochrome P450 4C1-like [Pectinophora gossypiella]XP_049871940.1 cytochrome P450 4C1-like [Pectinophora gossypiella]